MTTLDVLVPNRVVSRKMLAAATIVQMVAAAAFWGANHGTLPSPSAILSVLPRLWFEGNLAGELQTSMITNLEAIGITTVLSLLLSYSSVIPFFRPIVKLVSSFSFFGMVGFTFLFTLFFGGGHWLKVALMVFGMTPFFVRSMTATIAAIPKSDFDYARTLRMGEWRVLWEVVVLGRLSDAIDILRQNAAIGWMMLTMVEGLVRSEGGIGTMLLNENKYLKLDSVFALQIIILMVGIGQDAVIEQVRKILCPYADLKKER